MWTTRATPSRPAADIAAHQLIVRGLQQLTPILRVLSRGCRDALCSTPTLGQVVLLRDRSTATKELLFAGDEVYRPNIALSSTSAGCVSRGRGLPPATGLFWRQGVAGACGRQEQRAAQTNSMSASGKPMIVVAARRHTVLSSGSPADPTRLPTSDMTRGQLGQLAEILPDCRR